MGGRSAVMSFWNRPLRAMGDAFTATGFSTCAIDEPRPAPAARELFPDEYRMLATSPSFLFFVLRAA